MNMGNKVALIEDEKLYEVVAVVAVEEKLH
jgi:hypothetical protein